MTTTRTSGTGDRFASFPRSPAALWSAGICLFLGLLWFTAAHADGIFKNLQILPKDTDKPTLKAIMKKQAKALGVDCDHCHDHPDMAKDTDKKKISREMMTLVDQINKGALKPDAKPTGSKDFKKAVAYYQKRIVGKTPDKEVTCNTCHQGQEEPPK
jgi:hypothetical protein